MLRSVLRAGNRSKNEIYFANLCAEHYLTLTNIKMFEGWDSDVILPEHKIAVMWNGIFHYKKIARSHNLEAVQRRDKLKIEAIIRCGYSPYVIIDMGSYRPSFVEEQFYLFESTMIFSRYY